MAWTSTARVLLLDEIEKAHPDVYNILLQVMDHGKLTDSQRQEGRFPQRDPDHDHQRGRVGQQGNAIGFGRERSTGEEEAAIKRLFTPEFRNRLDAVISFKPLGRRSSAGGAEVRPAAGGPAGRPQRHDIELSPKPPTGWAKNGYDDKIYGARPLARVIQEHIKKPLADELLFGLVSPPPPPWRLRRGRRTPPSSSSCRCCSTAPATLRA
jgi:ATP-dependent Clp protease ATP-binding subunit ClpA